jgi:hypothetical protein
VRISPLEDTVVALRPIIPVVPFDLPNSVRPLNPMMPLGSTVMFNSVDAEGNPTDPIINSIVNFGWEYVWHCHILSHEEMDMMRPISVAVPPIAPTSLVVTNSGNGGNRRVNLSWVDSSKTETAFIIRRSLSPTGPWADFATVGADTATYSTRIGRNDPDYYYQVFASNTVGYMATPGYSTLNVTAGSNIAIYGGGTATLPAAPSNLVATAQSGPQVALSWTDNSADETGFVIERAIGTGGFATLATVGMNVTTFTDLAVVSGSNYSYRVAAANGAGISAYSNTQTVSTAAAPSAPSSATITVQTALSRNGKNATISVNWGDVANETGYTIQIATDAAFTSNVNSASVGADVTSYTFGKVARSTPYYVRMLAYNGSGSSAWVVAPASPVTTP